jgi:hypothetical protein
MCGILFGVCMKPNDFVLVSLCGLAISPDPVFAGGLRHTGQHDADETFD